MKREINRQFWFENVTEVAKAMKFIERFFSRKKFQFSHDQLDEMAANVIANIYQAGFNAKASYLDGSLPKEIDSYWVLQPTADEKLKSYTALACMNEIKNYSIAIGVYRLKTERELEAERLKTDEELETEPLKVSIQLFQEEYSSVESGFSEDGSAMFVSSSAYREPEREAIAEDLFVKVNNVVDLVLKGYKDEMQQVYLKDIFWRQHVYQGLTQHQLAEVYGMSPENTNMLLRRFKEKLKHAVTEILGFSVDSDEISELDGLINSLAGYINVDNLELPASPNDDEVNNNATGTDE
ncbi:TPA: hypothetical protein I7213_09590 [Vibrio vulnificus]|nr:hypothetical protein [Vibrio vulnificus]HDY7578935.1 hypothetical protein [Vibrio vulnificus]